MHGTTVKKKNTRIICVISFYVCEQFTASFHIMSVFNLLHCTSNIRPLAIFVIVSLQMTYITRNCTVCLYNQYHTAVSDVSLVMIIKPETKIFA